MIVNKENTRTCRIMDLAVPVDHKVKLKEREMKTKYQAKKKKQRKTIEHEDDGDEYLDRAEKLRGRSG